KFLQLLLNRMQHKDKLLYVYYDEEELKEYDVDQEEAAYALHIIQNIDGPEIVLLIRKAGEYIRGSLRAKKIEDKKTGKLKIDCNKIAQELGGGGHKLAAGFGMPAQGMFENQIQEIVKQINKMIKKTDY
ncbi:MAG TPA: DHHA1 domain-containing protein, partial [Candidatus Absconditabacterales bacterium]|nr:DHHA1 domain-containing protein [Candidatus Absconditabacterales bacterium]